MLGLATLGPKEEEGTAMGVCTRLRKLDDVATELGTGQPVAVLYCNNCVRACGSGGEAHMDRISQDLRQRGVRIEDELVVTNPCCRGFLEDYDPGGAVQVALLVACTPAAFAFQTLYPDIRTVVALETIGLFMNSKAKGRLKLATTFPGYEHLKGREFKLGDTTTMYEDEQLVAAEATEVSP
jgi:hypothetical protein